MNHTVNELKSSLRKQGRANRAALSESERTLASQQICRRVVALPLVQEVKSIALFWPMGTEVDIRPLWSDLAAKHLYAPFMRKHSGLELDIGFSRVSSETELIKSEYGFRQPGHESPKAGKGEIDLIMIPALLLTADGHRLGYGAGFYDRILASAPCKVKALVLGFECQIVSSLPLEKHDVAADGLVTEARSLVL